jgi:glycosyltransferase involved in cell wall biosynthesis
MPKPEVSVLMPTYNDAKYITNSIKSLQNQSFQDWELIVIDGSTDKTPEIVKQFAENDSRIRYLREQRSGQLNALTYGTQFVQGSYITILHSDDELSDIAAFDRNLAALKGNTLDGLFSDLLIMNAQGEITGRTRTMQTLTAFSPALLFLRAGSNIIPDFFFITKKALDNVSSSYMTWNMPYWLRFEEKSVDTLELKKVEPWYKYRVYLENYIRSEVGRFETVNGCLRTVLEISQRIDIPLLKLQRLLARILKTRARPLFKHKPSSPKHTQEMMKYVISTYFKRTPKNVYLEGLLGFYSNFPSNRSIELHFEEKDEIFLGKDARLFFSMMQKKSLPAICKHVLKEATLGFGNVIVSKEKDHERARDLLKFLNLHAKIQIK